MKKLMIRHTKEELAVAATAIKKCLMQQTINKIINEEFEANEIEIIETSISLGNTWKQKYRSTQI